MSCQSECSYHGNCVSGSCQCQTNFSGVDCGNMTAPMQIGETVSGYVSQGTWNYFYYLSNTESNIVFTLDVSTPQGDADIFVLKNSYPSLIDFDYVNASSLSSTTVTVDQPGQQYWFTFYYFVLFYIILFLFYFYFILFYFLFFYFYFFLFTKQVRWSDRLE